MIIFFQPHGKNMEQLFKVEVTLPYHLWGIKFLTCLEWFLHIQAQNWRGHQPVILGSFPLHCTHAICTVFCLLPTLPSKLFFFFTSLPIQPLLGWEGLLFWLWKINSHYRRERKKKRRRKERETRSRGREGDCYPCQSDPAWRLSSPLIALLISSPLSLELGQQGPSAGDDLRLSSFMISPSLCLFFCFRTISIRIKNIQ